MTGDHGPWRRIRSRGQSRERDRRWDPNGLMVDGVSGIGRCFRDKKHGTIVHLGYFQPFSGVMQAAAALLAEGKLGKVTHARFRNAHHAAYGRWFDSPDLAWFTDPALAGGGAFMDMGTHAVHAAADAAGPGQAGLGEDRQHVGHLSEGGRLRHRACWSSPAGCIGTVEASWVQTGGIGGLEITGSDGHDLQRPQARLRDGRARAGTRRRGRGPRPSPRASPGWWPRSTASCRARNSTPTWPAPPTPWPSWRPATPPAAPARSASSSGGGSLRLWRPGAAGAGVGLARVSAGRNRSCLGWAVGVAQLGVIVQRGGSCPNFQPADAARRQAASTAPITPQATSSWAMPKSHSTFGSLADFWRCRESTLGGPQAPQQVGTARVPMSRTPRRPPAPVRQTRPDPACRTIARRPRGGVAETGVRHLAQLALGQQGGRACVTHGKRLKVA